MFPARLLSPLLGLFISLAVAAGDDPLNHQRFVADIELQTAEELGVLLQRAQQMLVAGDFGQEDGAVVLVLHGPVLRSLLRNNYPDNQVLVNQAASLTAMGVLEVKACRTWMASNAVDPGQLQPFVDVVAYGPGEVVRLVEKEGYINF